MSLETLNIRSMLGLRFRDATTERPVTDGLRVSVRRADGRGDPQPAARTASGAYVAQGIAGLRVFERSGEPMGGSAPEAVEEEAVEVWISVEDEQGRYVPVMLTAKVPYEPDPANRGLLRITEMPEGSAEETREPTCYLFSSVRRPVRSGQAVVYADLVTGDSQSDLQPAKHAVLEVSYDPEDRDASNGNTGGNGGARGPNGAANGDSGSSGSKGSTWYGIADEQGRVAVQFPLPSIRLEELRDSGNGRRTNKGGGRPLSARTWPLTVRVRYSPTDRDRESDRSTEKADRPFLPSILGQKHGTLYAKASETTSELSATLAYGEPLVLQTNGLPDDRMVLRVDPHLS